MQKSSRRRSLVACSGAIALTFLVGCAGDNIPNGSSSAYKFSDTFLGCGQSLDITLASGAAFTAANNVQFESGTNSYDGSAVLIDNNKTLDCGFPAGAAKGIYRVIFDGKEIGEVQNLCAS